jgi:hypothetical protein
VTLELKGGVYRESALAPARRARLAAMLSAIPALAFDDLAAKTYGDIVASAGYSRRKLLDRMIARQLCDVPRGDDHIVGELQFSRHLAPLFCPEFLEAWVRAGGLLTRRAQIGCA